MEKEAEETRTEVDDTFVDSISSHCKLAKTERYGTVEWNKATEAKHMTTLTRGTMASA